MSSSLENILFYLITLSLLFYAFTSIGRVCLGMESARSPRYLIYTIPVFFAIYLMLVKWLSSSGWKSGLMLVLFLLLASIELLLHEYLPSRIQGYKVAKPTWKECYLKQKSIQKCNAQVGMMLVLEAPFAEESLQIMEKKYKLHIFK